MNFDDKEIFKILFLLSFNLFNLMVKDRGCTPPPQIP